MPSCREQQQQYQIEELGIMQLKRVIPEIENICSNSYKCPSLLSWENFQAMVQKRTQAESGLRKWRSRDKKPPRVDRTIPQRRDQNRQITPSHVEGIRGLFPRVLISICIWADYQRQWRPFKRIKAKSVQRSHWPGKVPVP